MAADSKAAPWQLLDTAVQGYAEVLKAKYQARLAASRPQQEALMATPDKPRNAQARAGEYVPPKVEEGGATTRTLLLVGGLLLAGAAAWVLLRRR